MNLCPNCGMPRVADAPLCGSCGAAFRDVDSPAAARDSGGASAERTEVLPAGPMRPTAATRSRRRWPIVAAGLIAIGVIVGAGLLAGTVLLKRETRSTPEAAVSQYMEAVAKADAAELVQACAIDEASTRFRFDLQAERLKAIVSTTTYLFPSDYHFYAEMNKSVQSALIFGQVRGLEYSLLQSVPVDQVITPVDLARAQQYVKDVDPSRLADMKVVSIKLPSPKLANDARNIKNWAAIANVYGADEMTERLALFQWNGKDYEVGFTLLRYGGDWKVLSQMSNLAGIGGNGTADPTTPEEFDGLTSGN